MCGKKTIHPADHFCSAKHYHIYLDELRKCRNYKFNEDDRCVLGNQPDDYGDCIEFRARDINKFKQRFIDEYEQVRKGIVWRNEPCRYMGPKWARIPRGSSVELIAVVNEKIGVFKYEGEVIWCSVRLLQKL